MGVPQFTPSGGEGSVTTDSDTGTSYRFTNSKWQQVSTGANEQQPTTPSLTGGDTSAGGKVYGGWYDNPATGRNQRWFNGVWTDGDEPGLPQSQDQVTPFLNQYQNGILGKSLPEVRRQLEGGLTRPEPISRVDLFQELRADQGVEDLETTLRDLKATEEEEAAAFRSQRFDERGKPVATNVIAGRVGKAEQQAQERLDFIGRQKSIVVDELNTKYTMIGQIMDFTGLDYQDAVQNYNDEFTKNLSVYQLMADEKSDAQKMASANLQIYMNAITSGNLDYGSLDSGQKALISKLEVQSGLPVGFTSSLKQDPDADILFTTSNKGVTQVGIRGADGQIRVESYGTRIDDGDDDLSESEFNRQASGEMIGFLTDNAGGDGYVSGDTYIYARRKWVEATGNATDEFDKRFRDYRNPGHLDQYQLGFDEANR